MIFKNYNYFISIVQEGSITSAARKLYISQPSLSKYLKRLEANLGIELFDHRTSPLKLTPAGNLYYDYLKKEMALEKELMDAFGTLKGVRAEDVNFASGPWVSSILMPFITPIIKEANPDLRIHNVVGDDDHLLYMAKTGQADFILLYDPWRWKNLSWQVIKKERIFLFCNKNHPFIKERNIPTTFDPDNIQPLDLRLLKNEDFVVATKGLTLNDIANTAFKSYDITPRSVQIAPNVQTVINTVSRNQSFSFIFESLPHSNFVPDCLTFFEVGDPPITCTLTAAYKTSAPPGSSAQTVIDCIKQFYGDPRKYGNRRYLAAP